MFIYVKCQIIINTSDKNHQFNIISRCKRNFTRNHFTIKLCEIFKHVPHVKISPKIDLIIRPDQEKNLSLIFFFLLIYNIVITA